MGEQTFTLMTSPNTPEKKDKPCKDHFLLMPANAKRNFSVCSKCGYKTVAGNTYRPVKFANRYFFEH